MTGVPASSMRLATGAPDAQGLLQLGAGEQAPRQ